MRNLNGCRGDYSPALAQTMGQALNQTVTQADTPTLPLAKGGWRGAGNWDAAGWR
ncbi:MAG: hypothetical protein LBJ61_11950 [Deltaproteobacteria bacterium]|jgi:hypothetical protein|nr:hypothetical protein [Deltaproteobacteria bacterium]